MFCSAETPPAQTLRLRPMRRMPAHPRRSSSKTQPFMFKTGHCRPHNSFDGLSGCFKACTSTLFARYSRAIHIAKRSLSCSKPASDPTGSARHALERLLIRAVQAAKRSLSCSKPAIAACITPLTASRVISRPVHPRYSRTIHMTKRSLSCLKPARIARASSPNASQTNCRTRIAHLCPSSVHGLQSPLSASSSPISPS